ARTTRYAVAPGGGSLTLDRFYFPGWQAQTDAGPAVVAPVGELGLLRVELPGSASWVDVSFGDTPVRTAALAVSLGGGAGVLALGATNRVGRRVAVVVGAVAMGTVVFAQAPRAVAQLAVRSPIGSFADGVRLLDAREDEPGVVQLVWTTDRPVADDLHVVVR